MTNDAGCWQWYSRNQNNPLWYENEYRYFNWLILSPSGFVIHGYLGARVLFTKSVGLALSVASGLSLGKEGPFVHIASCIGNIVSRFLGKYENNEGRCKICLVDSS